LTPVSPLTVLKESAASIINWASKTVNKLDGLDTFAWTEEQKSTFNQTLMNLQESIQAILSPSESDDANSITDTTRKQKNGEKHFRQPSYYE